MTIFEVLLITFACVVSRKRNSFALMCYDSVGTLVLYFARVSIISHHAKLGGFVYEPVARESFYAFL